MTNTDIISNWIYFRSLAKQLNDTEQFVDHAIDSSGKLVNGSVFSNEFAKLLMLSASEFEVIGKSLCTESGRTIRSNANIISITKEILSIFPHIGETSITTPYQTIQPLKNWRIGKVLNKNGSYNDTVEGIPWWKAYDKIKHNRRESFENANLQNSVDAIASLMVLELYLSKIVAGDMNKITSIGCDYFDCSYGLSYIVADGIEKLPDFQ